MCNRVSQQLEALFVVFIVQMFCLCATGGNGTHRPGTWQPAMGMCCFCVALSRTALFLLYPPSTLLHLQTLPCADGVQVLAAAEAQSLQATSTSCSCCAAASALQHNQAQALMCGAKAGAHGMLPAGSRLLYAVASAHNMLPVKKSPAVR